MSNTLLPCPFCGGEAAVRDIKEPSANGWVGCQRCRCFMDFVNNGKPQAIAAWNRRAQPENKPLTNAQRIRSMSDEELVKQLLAMYMHGHCDCNEQNGFCITEQSLLDWLQQKEEV